MSEDIDSLSREGESISSMSIEARSPLSMMPFRHIVLSLANQKALTLFAGHLTKFLSHGKPNLENYARLRLLSANTFNISIRLN